jgi:hypothetical protein
MPAQPQVRFSVKLPHGTLAFPRAPIDIPADAYFIWPFNFDMDGAHLRYATAQPMARLQNGNGVTYVFVASEGIAPEFAFDAGTEVSASTGKIERTQDATLISALHPGTTASITLSGDHGRKLQVLILSEAQARQAWLRQADGADQLWLTAQQIYFDQGAVKLSSIGDTHLRFATYPALASSINASLPLRNTGQDGLFTAYEAQANARTIQAQIKPLRDALPVPPVRIGGAAQAPMQPIPETFGDAAAWSIELPAQALDGLRDAYLQIDYQGDVGRLFAGTALLDDNYYNGQTWQVGLRHFASTLTMPWTLTVLPLRADSPIYIQAPYWPRLREGEQVARVIKVEMVPVYGLDVRLDGQKLQ